MTHQAPYWSLCGIPCAVAISLYANMTPMLSGMVPNIAKPKKKPPSGGPGMQKRIKPDPRWLEPADPRAY